MNQPETAPAGGAEVLDVILVTAGALAATVALVALGLAHRSGRTNILRRFADFAARDTGIASWAALPSIMAAISLIIAAAGMYWDISLHIDDGRDAGPLANPAHYLILFGLFGIFAAGWLAIVLPDGKPSPRAVRITGDWYAPLGGIALLAAAGFALTGFPLDDVWHRIFGQDVTLWGPTHLMLIGGAALTLIGTSVLIVEGRADSAAQVNWRTALARGRRTFAFGGLLIGLSTFQGEFDFGVPQFNLVLEPVMLAFAAGIALVGARLWIGRGAALGAALFFIAVRGGLALVVGPGFGETTPHLPLYLAEAACVEALALAAPRLLGRPYAFGAFAGLLIGTVGFAAEYAWSHVWMPVPWPEGLIGDAILPVLIAALAAGIVGAFLGTALNAAEGRRVPGARSGFAAAAPAAAGLAAIAIVVGLNVGDSDPGGVTGEVTLTETSPAPEREAQATVRITPTDIADDAKWVSAIAWQGGEKLELDHLDETTPGVYETGEPLPLYGTWKTLIRVHSGDALLGLPLYLPEDSAIPAEAVTSPEGTFQRPFVDETEILQRELKDGVPGYLAAVAYLAVGSIVLGIIALLGWVLVRLGDGRESAGESRPSPAKTRRPRRATGVPGATA
jgi:hypothetical protein